MQIPQRIGKYTVIERIGRGGMGFVYRGVDPILKRDVALKTMLKDISEDPELRSRFMREAQSAGGLRHPNIVTIYDLGEDEEGCPYIAMEFLTGTDLEHIIKNRIELQLTKKLDIIIQTALGLGYAHSNGIIHRDIKPANIRLLDHGEVKIMDFGIAKIAASHFTRTGMIMGTPHYMSPEQIRGEKVDGRADIFSLGVVLFELLTNRKPFPGDNPTTVLFKIIHSGPDPLTDTDFTPPENLEEIVLRALAKKQEERYQTCEEFAADLMNVYDRIQPPAETLIGGSGSSVPFSMPSGTPTPRWAAKTVRQSSVAPRTPAPGQSATVPKTPIPPTQVKPQQPEPAPAATHVVPIGAPPPSPIKTGPTQKSIRGDAPGSPALSALSISPEARKWILIGIGAVVCVFLFSMMLITAIKRFSRQENPIPAPPKKIVAKQPVEQPKITPAPIETPPVIPPPASESGWLILNVQPWAEIQELKDEKGNLVTPTSKITPCRIQLPAGKYRLTASNPKFPTAVYDFEIKLNGTTTLNRKLSGFDYGKAIDSLVSQ